MLLQQNISMIRDYRKWTPSKNSSSKKPTESVDGYL